MKYKHLWKRHLGLFCALALFTTPLSTVFAAEPPPTDEIAQESAPAEQENAAQPTPTEEPERLEPDAFFEPVASNQVADWPQGPPVWAESATVMDLDSGAILYSKNMDVIKYPASITKIMTTLLAIEHARPHERVTFSKHAIYGIERNSSHIGIRVGEILSMKECWYGMMLESANEVCLAVAEHIGGSVDGFVAMMNQKAAELGCTNTHFTNPNGLPDENHYTTAHDMALISRAAYKNKTFRKVISTGVYKIPKTNMCGEERWLNNHHKMLPERKFSYEGCTGGKTGFTQVALNTLVTFAERNGRTLVCVMLRTNGAQIYADTAMLLDYGFQNFINVPVYNRASCMERNFLYPSILAGHPTTLASQRLSCQLTLPSFVVAATPDPESLLQEQVITHTEVNPSGIYKTYTYHDYPVGNEILSTTPIRSIMTAHTDDEPASIRPEESTPLEITPTENEAPATQGNKHARITKIKELFLKLMERFFPQGFSAKALLNLLATMPLYLYVLLGLLIFLIILETFILIQRHKKKKRQRKNRKKSKK